MAEQTYQIKVGEPFIVTTTSGRRLILQAETTFVDGQLSFYQEIVLDDNPSEQEIFKITLHNPNVESQVAWGLDELYSVPKAVKDVWL